ncbi:hypothetical protein [Deinococcus sp. NW-56]|uniref:hypothetical protein n=1 Tax=Deinococcus sp. NW-56 TaxID=2080419 RepID=UPI00131A40D6|nr:hypothetical protein [Deinococcus sp. NW-56]
MTTAAPLIYQALPTSPDVRQVTLDIVCARKQDLYRVSLSGVQGDLVRLLGPGGAVLLGRLSGHEPLGLWQGGGVGAVEGGSGQGPRTYRHTLTLQIEPGQWGAERGAYVADLALTVESRESK